MDLCTSFEKEVKKYDLSQLWCPCTGNVCEYCGAALPYNGPDHVHIDNSRNTVNVIYNNNYYSQEAPVRQIEYVQQIPAYSPKSRSTALILCIFFGWLGVHRFYVGKVGTGLLYMFSAGALYIGWIVDIISIAKGTFRDSNGLLLVKENQYGNQYGQNGYPGGGVYSQAEYAGRGYFQRGSIPNAYGQGMQGSYNGGSPNGYPGQVGNPNYTEYPMNQNFRAKKKNKVFLVLTILGALLFIVCAGNPSSSFGFLFFFVWTIVFLVLWIRS